MLFATLLVPAILLGNVEPASGQARTQPSPTGTAPAIQLLNPSDYTTPTVISDEDTSDSDTDRRYHFTAVISNAPSSPFVEFFLIQGDNSFTLGCAGPAGSGCQGTFGPFGAVGLLAEIPDAGFNEGPNMTMTSDTSPAVVRAILYANNGQNEVARDNQDVILNQKDPASDTLNQGEANPQRAAETVEIVYPVHGGIFGVFKPGSPAGVGVIDVEWSAGTDGIDVYYSVSPPDADPAWKSCGSERTSAGGPPPDRATAEDGVRCTLVDGDFPEAITAVAAVARDLESDAPQGERPELRNNSGDAHRVVGYSQRVGLVEVTGATAPAPTGTGDCSPLLSAQVFDNSSPRRPIAGINVDVHAQGPTDNLDFNTYTATDATAEQSQFDQTKPDRSKAPENHPTEAGRRCSNDNPAGTQGVHAVGGGPDRKHIESADNSDDQGRFAFRLWSEAQGGTTVTAWADTGEDDRFCPDEVGGSNTVTWGSGGPAAPPAEGPEPQPCPAPSPSGSGSASATPTPTPTATATPTPTPSQTGTATPTPTPTPTGTQTGTATPPPTATPSPTPTSGTTGGTQARAETETTLEASQSRKTFGKTFTLSGTVTSDNEACTRFADVRILRDTVGGEDDFELFAQTDTDENGAFTESFRADRSANYVAQVDETATCESSTSTAEPVLVRVKVSLRLSDGRVARGERIRINIRTAPCPATARDKVLLFRAIEGQFGKSGKKRSNASCKATFRRRIQSNTVFQGRWPKQVPEFLAGKSRSKAVRVVR